MERDIRPDTPCQLNQGTIALPKSCEAPGRRADGNLRQVREISRCEYDQFRRVDQVEFHSGFNRDRS